MTEQLTRVQMEVLEFERARWASAGRRETAIFERFAWNRIRHVQVVASLLEHPGAMAYDPQTVNRLAGLRDRRRQQRSAPPRAVTR